MIAPLIGGLITGGLNILGGLFGRSDAKKQKKADEKAISAANAANAYNAELTRLRAMEAAKVPIITKNEPTKQESIGSVDMAAFMKAAESNGFNPLTFLRSGALGAFAKTVTTTTGGGTATYNSRLMDAVLGGGSLAGGSQVQPVLSSVNVPGVGSIIAGGVNSGFNRYLEMDQAQRQEQLQYAALQAQLTGAQRSGSMVGGRTLYTPAGVATGQTYSKSGNAALSSNQFAKGQKYSGPGDLLMVGGLPWRTNPNTSDADAFEQRYSDPGGWVGAAGALANDYYLNADPQSRALMDFVSQTPGKVGKDVVDWYSGALSRTSTRVMDIPKIGSDYLKSISQGPGNPGKTWGQIGNDAWQGVVGAW